MRYIMFMSRFRVPILEGTKNQTIRATARIKPGEPFSLRYWDGLPYRSKQRVILEPVTCLSVSRVAWSVRDRDQLFVSLDGRPLNIGETDAFVRADGFRDVADFLRHWFGIRGADHYNGRLIRWAVH
jgi:hypothetical protein